MTQNPTESAAFVAARLMADPELDGPVGVSLAVLNEHLERFAAIDPAAFHEALGRFTAARPFLTNEDALRAVLRDFGVRAKITPAHLSIVGWHEDGWQLMEIHPDDLSRSRRI
ncbi:hypothetical protein [Kocuria sp. CH-021]|uniref:hypothetical protein n=1 Tax=Kocuria sp. CH-021 TaxID=3406735 RepID=UPI003C7839F4